MRNLRPSAIREIMKMFPSQESIMLAGGNPAVESFPIEEIRKISAEILEDMAPSIFQYGMTEGFPPLRAHITDWLKRRYGIGWPSEEIVITSGSQQAVELTCRAFLNEGDAVICENPSYMGALNIFRSYNANLVGVDSEPDGISIPGLEKALAETPNVKLVYLIPNFQNPTGITMSLEKRRAAYEMCKARGVVIIEDNPYGELRYRGEDLPPIKTMDEDGIVVYCGSFSKIFSAGIRIGFALAATPIARRIVLGKQVSDVHSNTYAQALLAKYFEDYDIDRHIEFIRGIYARKSALMLKCMDEHLSACSYQVPDGGLFIWCELPNGMDSMDFCVRAAKRCVAVVPGSAFTVDPDARCSAFRLNYSTPTDEKIERGIAILGEVLAECLAEERVEAVV